jgi:hypothetical protein
MSDLIFLLSDSMVFFQRYRFLAAFKELEDSFNIHLLTSEAPSLYQDLWKLLDKLQSNISYLEVREGSQAPDGDAFVIHAKECMEGIKIHSTVGELPFWKFTLFDDLRGSISKTFYEIPALLRQSSGVFLPLPSINRSPSFGNYYSYQLYKTAKDCGIPVIGIETQSLDKKYYYHNLFYDFFILKDPSSKEFLSEIGIEKERLFLLREKYKLIFSDSDFHFIANLKFIFDDLALLSHLMKENYFIVTVISRFSERYAMRRLLRIASKVDKKIAIVAIAHPDVYTISLTEREVLQRAFIDELEKSEFQNFFILETPRTNLSFLNLFSDIIVSTAPQIVSDLPCLPDNVIVYNPSYSHFRKFFSEIRNFYTRDEEVENYIKSKIECSKDQFSFKKAVETILNLQF